jgi:hypothetical protein
VALYQCQRAVLVLAAWAALALVAEVALAVRERCRRKAQLALAAMSLL